jgi:ankyrin repeat protein
MREYLNAPQLTAEKFTVDVDGKRWFKTGDLAKIGSDGSIEIFGRADNQIKLHGFRIGLEEVEEAVCTSGLVAGCAVKLGSNPTRLVGYVVPTPSLPPTAFAQGGAVAVWLVCKRAMPAHQIPMQFVTVDILPLAATGKVDRTQLPPAPRPTAAKKAPSTKLSTVRDPDSSGGVGVESSSTAGIEGGGEQDLRTPTERVLANVWSSILGVDGIGPSDHFFELGGNSITAIRMIRTLATALKDDSEACDAAYEADIDHSKVRLCGLHRKPRLREYASLIDWAALAAPNRSATDAAKFRERLQGGVNRVMTGGEMLAQLDADLPTEADELGRGADAMVLAVQHGNLAVVKELLRLGISPNGRVTRSNKANTPLMIAVMNGHRDIVRVLMHGPETNASASTSTITTTATRSIASRPFTPPNLNLTNRSQATVAHLAAAHCPGVLAELLDAGCVGNARDLNKWTVLHHAAWSGSIESIGVLAERRVYINNIDRWRRVPLHWAVFGNHIAAARALVAAGATFTRGEGIRNQPQARAQRRHDNVWSSMPGLAIQAAIAAKDLEFRMLRTIFELGCPPNDLDGNHQTGLHEAAALPPAEGGAVATAILLRAGCSPSAEDEVQQTALQVAAEGGHAEVAQLLLDAAPSLNPTSGTTAAELIEILARGGVLWQKGIVQSWQRKHVRQATKMGGGIAGDAEAQGVVVVGAAASPPGLTSYPIKASFGVRPVDRQFGYPIKPLRR